jgi:ankyrin repeat protein
MCELLQKAHEAHSFPESLKEILEMLAPGQKGEPDKTGELCKINVRIEDPEKQTCLHKLARVKSDELTFEHKTKYKNVITTLLACLRVQCAAEKKVLKDDINLADKYGKTPLFLAVENKNSLLIKDLYSQENGVKYEPDAMKANANGWTVLHAPCTRKA